MMTLQAFRKTVFGYQTPVGGKQKLLSISVDLAAGCLGLFQYTTRFPFAFPFLILVFYRLLNREKKNKYYILAQLFYTVILVNSFEELTAIMYFVLRADIIIGIPTVILAPAIITGLIKYRIGYLKTATLAITIFGIATAGTSMMIIRVDSKEEKFEKLKPPIYETYISPYHDALTAAHAATDRIFFDPTRHQLYIFYGYSFGSKPDINHPISLQKFDVNTKVFSSLDFEGGLVHGMDLDKSSGNIVVSLVRYDERIKYQDQPRRELRVISSTGEQIAQKTLVDEMNTYRDMVVFDKGKIIFVSGDIYLTDQDLSDWQTFATLQNPFEMRTDIAMGGNRIFMAEMANYFKSLLSGTGIYSVKIGDGKIAARTSRSTGGYWRLINDEKGGSIIALNNNIVQPASVEIMDYNLNSRAKFPLEGAVRAMDIDPERRLIYTYEYTRGILTVINMMDGRKILSKEVGLGARSIAVDHQGDVYIDFCGILLKINTRLILQDLHRFE